MNKLFMAVISSGIVPDAELTGLVVDFVAHIKKAPVDKRLDVLKKAIRNAMDDAPRVYDGEFVPKKTAPTVGKESR